jgi:hypothetical protein
MPLRSIAALAILCLAGLHPAVARAAGDRHAGSVTFHVVVSGAVRDRGTVSAALDQVATPVGGADFDGCAVIKQAHSTPLGAYTFELHVHYNGGLNLLAAGIKPTVAQELYLQIGEYRPGTTAYALGSPGVVDVRFAINGHVYGTASRVLVRMRHGGLDGTIDSQDALRLYPAAGFQPLHGVTYQATWHCTALYHITAQA